MPSQHCCTTTGQTEGIQVVQSRHHVPHKHHQKKGNLQYIFRHKIQAVDERVVPCHGIQRNEQRKYPNGKPNQSNLVGCGLAWCGDTFWTYTYWNGYNETYCDASGHCISRLLVVVAGKHGRILKRSVSYLSRSVKRNQSYLSFLSSVLNVPPTSVSCMPLRPALMSKLDRSRIALDFACRFGGAEGISPTRFDPLSMILG